MNPRSPGVNARAGAGFTLVELMVGMAIALIASLVMFEVLIAGQRSAETTSSGNDALGTAAVSMHLVERDLMQAGFGLSMQALFGCTLALPTGARIPLAPVSIGSPLIPGADPGTETLLVTYGTAPDQQPEGNVVASVAGTMYTLQAPGRFQVGDQVIAFDGNCTTPLALSSVVGVGPGTVTTRAALATATSMFNLGASPRIVGYRIRSSQLETCDFMVANCSTNGPHWVALAANVVSLRAEYGASLQGDANGVVVNWTQGAPASACQWADTRAVRLALVARSATQETRIDAKTKQRVCDAVTTDGTGGTPKNAPTWRGAASTPITLPGSNWQCFRYRTLENTVPLRNVVFMTPC